MSTDHVEKQEHFTNSLIRSLHALGVNHFCISPGSRSSILTLALSQCKEIQKTIHFDERGMAFYALGLAKASKKPVALVVTSGTAVGNLFPAVMEASLDGVPLILLTCDRPSELFDTGANQTADQVKIFGKYVRWEVDVGSYDELPLHFVETTAAQAVHKALGPTPGPVQINCRYREPFFAANTKGKESSDHFFSTIYERGKRFLTSSVLTSYADLFTSKKKGVIFLASLPCGENLDPIFSLAEKLRWPVVSDIMSNARSQGSHPLHIPYSDFILERSFLEADCILQFGSRFVSKRPLFWVKKHPYIEYFLVAEHPNRQDPEHIVTHRIEQSPSLFAEQILSHLTDSYEANPSWLSLWQEKGKLLQESFCSLFTEEKLSEPSLFFSLSSLLTEKHALFLANSMPIRDANHFFYPSSSSSPIFANRGLSGIDGNIATAVGIAEGLQKPVIAALGDLTFLHDMNSLALLKKSRYPVICLVINNQGGGIFSFLPVNEKKEAFEEYFATAHDFTFSHLAPLFSLPYTHLESKTWKETLEKALEQNVSCILEISSNRKENHALHKEILEKALLVCKETDHALV